MDKQSELDEELMMAIEASLAGSGIRPQWVFDHIIATVRKYSDACRFCRGKGSYPNGDICGMCGGTGIADK